jgi:hypothetical protein
MAVERGCIEGCGRPARKSRRRCSACEHAIHRYGDPFYRPERSGKGKGQLLLQELLLIETDECIMWPLHTNSGYGYVRRDGRNVGVHVIACEQRHGPPPSPKHEVAHSCIKNRACLNYRHLRWATRAENLKDSIAHGTISRGERRPLAKLTEADVHHIRAVYTGARGQVGVLAREFGVSYVTVHDVLSGRTWAWLEAA